MTAPPDPATDGPGAEPDPAAVGFVLNLGRALHSYGESSQRLESVIVAMADRLELGGAQFAAQPTSLMASFGPLERQRTYMLRVEPGEVNLGKLAAVERVALEVVHGTMRPGEGTATLRQIADAPSPYGPVLTTLSYAGISGTTCQLLGGGGSEILAATLLGLGLHLFQGLVGVQPRVNRVFEPLAAFFVSLAAVALAQWIGGLSVLVATLGGLIVLLPGLTLTTALSELANRHLAAGTARMSGAFITFLALAFGVALGNRLGAVVFGTPTAATIVPLPDWTKVLALFIAPLFAVVILRAPPRDAPWIVAASILGVEGGRLGAAGFGVELGAFVGAFAVAVASNAYASLRRISPAVMLVPSLLLLVPGSVGFRSLTSLVERQALAGIETAFSMVLTAVALVSGLLMAGVIAPEPRLRDVRER